MIIKNYLVISLMTIISFVSFTLSAASFLPPTTASSNLTFNNIDGNRMTLFWTKGDGMRRIVIASAIGAITAAPSDGTDYNANSQFGNGDQIGPGEYVVYDGTSSNIVITNLIQSTTYHFRIYEYNGSNASTEYLTLPYEEGSQATLSAPSMGASALMFTEILGHSIKLSWTNGDGDGRIVIVSEDISVNSVPQDYTVYNGNSTFGSGSAIGPGDYVVYKGSGSLVTIKNLEPEKTYHVAIFEYNGTNGPVYLPLSTKSSQLTAGAPTMEASNISFAFVEANRFNVSFTKGNGARRLIIAKKDSPVTAIPANGATYTASSTFGNGTELAPGEFVMYQSTGSNAYLNNLVHSSSYYVKIFEYNGTGTNTKFLTNAPLNGDQSTLFPPMVQTQNLNFTNITGNAMTINWTNGDGGSRLIVVKEAGAVDFTPTNYANYNTSASFTGGASNYGNGNYGVYNGTATSVTVTNLAPNTVYHVAAFERNGTSSHVYLTPGAAASQQTVGAPSTPTSNLTFGSIEGGTMRLLWDNGNGSRRIVIAKKGSGVTATPVNGASYTANTQFGMGTAIAADEFIVYDGTSTNVTVRNLDHSSTYHFRIFEYNGSGANTFYLTANFESGSQSTLFPPTTTASNIVFSNLTPISVKIDFTSGDGARRIIIVKAAAAVDVIPQHYQTYNASTSFGNGTQFGATGNFVVYKAPGNSMTLNNLEAGITYHFAIFEFNGLNSPVYQTTSAIGQVTLPFLPTVQASNLNYDNIGAKEIRVIWTKGNGAKRIILAKKDTPVDASPVDGVDYTANINFGTGDELGTGNFVVYNNQSNSFYLKMLEVNTTYHFAIFEYAGTGVNTTYLNPAHTANQATVAKPTISTTAVSVSNLTATTATIGWTNGNGTERMVVMSANDPLNTIPVDGQNYAADYRYGSGATIGNGFVLYKGTGTSVNITTLVEGTTYHIAVFEFNGVTYSPAFNETAGTQSTTTSGPPATQTSALSSTVLSSTSLQLSWTKGSGQKRIVIAKEGAAVDVTPSDGTDYTANAGFGSGAELGTGNFVMYAGPGDNLIISSLTENATYHFAVFEYNFSGNNTRYLTASPATLSTTVLPVQLTFFTGKATKEGVELQWQTATELNNDYFELQHSTDGHNFSAFAKVDGSGTSLSIMNYEFFHKNTLNGIHYYRLRQVDFDGKFQFSSVISVQQDNGKSTIEVYPNPVSQQLTVILENKYTSPVQAYIFDSLGKVVQEITIAASVKKQTLNVRTLPAGLYQFKIKGRQPISFVKE